MVFWAYVNKLLFKLLINFIYHYCPFLFMLTGNSSEIYYYQIQFAFFVDFVNASPSLWIKGEGMGPRLHT